jgi:hypothetical protein
MPLTEKMGNAMEAYQSNKAQAAAAIGEDRESDSNGVQARSGG